MDQSSYKYDIFISYRRAGGEALAFLLSDRLSQLGYRVFYDVESLRSGKFNEKIYEVIKNCKDVLLILSPNALNRCKHDDDWVRREILLSLEYEKNIIPVKMRQFKWPTDLPEDIADIAKYNEVNCDMAYFDSALGRIISMLYSSSGISLRNSKYLMLYYSFENLFQPTLIKSHLNVDNEGRAYLYVNCKNNEFEKAEYTYKGSIEETPQNIYIHTRNDKSSEQLFLTLYKPAGSMNRFIGIMSALSPTMTPVAFKTALFNETLTESIDEHALSELLKHNNKEWNSDILAMESWQLNLFYSEKIFINH